MDTTAIAIVALAPYYGSNTEVKIAVDEAIEYLSTRVDEKGRVGGAWGSNSNSTAVTIWALCSLGIDPAKDSRFINNGNTIVDGMYSYMLDDGSFGYQDNSTSNLMATQQCYEAIIAMDRLNSGKCAFYNFVSDDHKWVHTKVKPTFTHKGYEADACDSCGKMINIKTSAALKPAAPAITKLNGSRKAFTAKWSKKSYTGYEMRYSRYSSMKSAKTLRFTSSKTVSKKVTRLNAKKRYYVQVRSYKTVNGKRVYSSWSSKKSVKTK